MNKILSKIISLKVGKAKELINKEKIMQSAINKTTVEESYLTDIGFKGDDQVNKKYHGGPNKAVLFYSSLTYEKVNEVLNINLDYKDISPLGENILVSDITEDDICVGDILKLGEAIVQVTQPREPCNVLSINTKNKEMLKTVMKYGYTGWYAKVLEEGVVKQTDNVELVERLFPNLTIAKLNKAKSNPKDNLDFIQEAVSCEVLGAPFKEALAKHLR
ncbi:MOSC domain-containing protein [Arcobacter sp. F2176]|uniref:MOSC domain-containing protein n=1 Tax=Arcobacter sp. F2176 TaxID=2044511 RepID=UPI00100A71D2|nr:MOSC domain-containing protein [Arcobacter sp. F2176]RXJ82533.1 MOSC domain-containing protein [Arcobacter sp. F2176]